MPCGTTTQWQPRILTSAPLELAENTPCGPPSKLSSSSAISALRASWSSLNWKISSLRPCLAAKSRFDTIRKMPASALALIRPCFHTFSCAVAGADSRLIVAVAMMAACAISRVRAMVIMRVLPCWPFGRPFSRLFAPAILPSILCRRTTEKLRRRQAGDAGARGSDDVRNGGFVARRHDVDAGDMWDAGQLGNEIEADAAAFRRRVARTLHARDDCIRDDGAEQFFLDPARRLRRAQRHDADDERQLLGGAVLRQPRHVAAHHAGIHAELRLYELRAGIDLGLQSFRLPAGLWVNRIVGAAEEEIGAAGNFAPRGQFAGVAPPARGFQQRTRIEIEHRLGIGLVAG